MSAFTRARKSRLFAIFRLNVLLIHYILSYGRRQRQLIVGNTLPIPVLDLSLSSTRTRELWVKVRSRDWWERVVLMEFTDSEWRENFPMSRSSFSWLCVVVDPFMRPEETSVRPPVPLPMRVAIVLYKLGSCGEYRLVANQFGVHKSTVKSLLPDMEEATQIAARFQRAFGLPQIIGCVDGTHIPTLPPPSDGYRDFVNRKGRPSYVLQGVVDDQCWYVFLPGSAHDANVLRNELFKQAHRLPKASFLAMEVEGVGVNFYVIGDPAYPLLHWLIKGNTRARNLTAEEKSFNAQSEVADPAEKNGCPLTFCPFIIVTCCALHNFCERDTANPRWMQEATTFETQLPQPGNPPANNANEMGRTVREAITNYMAANFPLRQGVNF
uniref:DDE Tnp4 domain-containing protein n=1 Tax=Neogobius melanostomus TaxID=47308 RepID=A0A8C6TMD2_9GOBI